MITEHAINTVAKRFTDDAMQYAFIQGVEWAIRQFQDIEIKKRKR